MSQIETNPLLNPTHIVQLPMQTMEVKPTTQSTNFRVDPSSFVRSPLTNFSDEQMSWLKFASKNKFVATATWPISTIGSWYTLPLDFNLVKQLIPIGLSFQTFFNMNTLLISVKPTSNAFFQGYSKIFFVPTSTTYYADLFDFPAILPLERLWQLESVNISPKTSDEINLEIPINFPLEFFKVINDPINSVMDSYMSSYSWGHLLFYAVSPLNTTSTLTNLKFNISAQVPDLASAGTNF